MLATSVQLAITSKILHKDAQSSKYLTIEFFCQSLVNLAVLVIHLIFTSCPHLIC